MGKKLLLLLISFCVLAPLAAYPKARLLSKAGFVDLDRLVHEYVTRYLDGEISKREKSIAFLRESLQKRRARSPGEEHDAVEEKIRKHGEALRDIILLGKRKRV